MRQTYYPYVQCQLGGQEWCTHPYCREKVASMENNEKKPDPVEEILEAVHATLSPMQEAIKRFREGQDIARVALEVKATGKPQTIHGVLIIPKDYEAKPPMRKRPE